MAQIPVVGLYDLDLQPLIVTMVLLVVYFRIYLHEDVAFAASGPAFERRGYKFMSHCL
jgi:hypothetical protein